jgi:NAD(P)-dependent dehydrogenase (short-subunit alcohol dehydrogenase family)
VYGEEVAASVRKVGAESPSLPSPLLTPTFGGHHPFGGRRTSSRDEGVRPAYATLAGVKAALITGGSSGIGLAIARGLRHDGYELMLAARNPERLEAARRELGAEVFQANVFNEDECMNLVAAHAQRFGRLDVLVNSAGVGVAGRIGDTSTKHWDLQQAVNLRATFLVTREALPLLREANGYVVNLASIAGTIAAPGLAVYGAAKAAVIALTRSLVREESASGVRATALCPGFVDTRMAEWTGLPKDELIQPEDCAELVRALLRLSGAARVPLVVIERAGEALSA